MRNAGSTTLRNLLNAGYIVLLLCVPMGADATPPFPSIAIVADEIALSPGSTFAEACSTKAQQLAKIGHYELGDAVLTYSKDWGLIWRVDLAASNQAPSPLVNRVICWRLPSDSEIQITMAFGQETSPLSEYIERVHQH